MRIQRRYTDDEGIIHIVRDWRVEGSGKYRRIKAYKACWGMITVDTALELRSEEVPTCFYCALHGRT